MKKRITLLFHSCLLLLIAGCAGLPSISDGPVIDTFSGPVRGFKADNQTWCWKGIPYALPPVGNLRWKPPRPPGYRTEILDARTFGEPCTQHLSQGGPVIGSEDCLYLNIWRPRSDDTDLPVYVFIHGGGNANGSAGMFPDYDGALLAHRAKIICVTVNYRLGPFGWFLHPALRKVSAGNPLEQSGNYGLLDIIFALRWVRDNIAAFGGNPDNVTVGGQSAGGVNVLALMLSEEASGLFHQAICRSGLPMDSSMTEGYRRGEEVLAELFVAEGAAPNADAAAGLAAAMSAEEQADYLRSRSAEELLDCYNVVSRGLENFPFHFTDGTVLSEKGFEAFKQGAYSNKVPLIIGCNRDEFSLFMIPRTPAESRTSRHRSAVTLASRLWKADGVDAIARSLSAGETRPSVYAYYFLWGSDHRGSASVLPGDWSTILGASHSLEIPIFNGNHKQDGSSLARPLFTRKNRKGRVELSDRINVYLSNFMRTGNPNTPDVPETPWLPWSPEAGEEKCIILDAGFSSADIYMSYDELFAKEILQTAGRYMNWKDFGKVMDKVFWR